MGYLPALPSMRATKPLLFLLSRFLKPNARTNPRDERRGAYCCRKRRDAKDRRGQRVVRWRRHFLAFSNLMPPRVIGLCLAKFERCQVSNASILMEAGVCFHACWCR